jgi:hypothetical protein
VRVFLVPEPAKKRYRIIKHPAFSNSVLGSDTVLSTKFPSKAEIAALVHKVECAISLDMASWFDQVELSPLVSRRYCFRKGGRFFRATTPCMGERRSVELCAAITRCLMDFPKSSAGAEYLDGVIFVGSREDVIRDTAVFLERVRAVGAKVNEDVSNLDALVETSLVWGGIALDFTRKTTALSKKVIDKIATSWELRGWWTWRTWAGHVGCLAWAVGILNFNLAAYFELYRFVSSACSFLADHPDQWDSPALVRPSAWVPLELWTMAALRNQPRVVPVAAAPELIIVTEASSYGWAYYAVNNITGAVRTHGEPWSDAFRNRFSDKLGTSTFTESQAIVNACCMLLDPAKPARVRVVSDNAAAVAVFSNGRSWRSYHMNACVDRLASIFGDGFSFDYVHIPGVLNPADKMSRHVVAEGEEVRDSSTLSAAELRRIVGAVAPPGISEWPRVAPS